MRYIITIIILLFLSISPPLKGYCQTTLLDKGWEFKKESDSEWKKVDIPHDWAIFGPFDRDNDLQEVAVVQNFETQKSIKRGRTGGLPYVGKGYYRRVLKIEKRGDHPFWGKNYLLLFDGAMSEAVVAVNGKEAIYWPYGYNSFYCDITNLINDDGTDNEILVKIENLPQSSRWYPGAGLYRNVYLIENNKVHIPIWGTQIITDLTNDYKKSDITIFSEIEGIKNDIENVTISTSIYSPEGTIVAKSENAVFEKTENEKYKAKQLLKINNPVLWSPESPKIYRAKTKIYVNGDLSDEYTTPFGIRTIEVKSESGFFLNGKNRKFKGVCLHHDLGPLGAAVNKSAIRHQLNMLKDMGCDAIRTTHNMPAPELIQLCDEMGFMVILENFDEWDEPKCLNGYHRHFKKWAEKDMINMLHQYRNSPSVVMWSIGNEVPTQWKPEGFKVATFLRDICHREDPTRPITCGMDQVDAVLSNGFAAVMDVPGLNYRTHKYVDAYERLPQKMILGSESASTVSSRGEYFFPVEKKADALHNNHQSSSYDVEYCSWSNIPDEDFALSDDYPWTMGQFVWTGFDYLGEPSPYDTDAWPNHSSVFGIIDMASIPKDRYYLYRSVWNNESPTLHILPHWNWKGREGAITPVYVYTSYPKAELFLNGRSQGMREKSKKELLDRYRLRWNDVKYEAGELKVVAYNQNGEKVDEKFIVTADKAHHIELVNCSIRKNEDKELLYIRAIIVDKNGNLCPNASNTINIEVNGGGKFKAIANGDPTNLELFHIPSMKAFNGMLTTIVEVTCNQIITIEAQSKNIKKGKLIIK
jgi:beta-galactosidase